MSLIVPVLASALMALSADVTPHFTAARPIWPKDRETEKNLFVGFHASFDGEPDTRVTLRVTGSTLYRVFVNGEFLCHGPARACPAYFRVDELDITSLTKAGANDVAIEVAGYNANSYYLLDQPAFVRAEILRGDDVLAATGADGKDFEAHVITERVQKVQRYSFQRPFIEVYRLGPDWDAWRTGGATPDPQVACAVQPDHPLLPRRVSYPAYTQFPPQLQVAEGTVETGVAPEHLWKDRSLVNIGPKLKGYPENELDMVLSTELQQMRSHETDHERIVYGPETKATIDPGSYRIFSLGTNRSGFLGATVECTKPTRFYMTFDEILSNGDVDFKRLGCVNCVLYELKPGTYNLESFEPYTAQYVKLMALDGACTVSNVHMREYVNPDTWGAHFAASDDRLNILFEAGRETFVQNAVDIFMDCPSRERAGWLGDSLFTARTAYDLCGTTVVEKNFFENFMLPDDFEYLPKGMLPMCYPADHNDGVYIPNWAMWFVIQLNEYLDRTNDRTMIDALKPRVLALLKYFEPYRNGDGLLEKLDSWVFVEWSEANKFVQDVNYPTNMLYAAVLDTVGGLYDMPELRAESERLRQVIRDQSYDGEFFVDNAVRTDGKLEVTRNRSEICQYYAFFFDVATPETYPDLWNKLCTQFGPGRKQTKAYPEVHFANSFMGNMLRFEVLSRYGKGAEILPESIDYLLYMAERTGTLWENDTEAASCDHGFASHIVHTLYRDVLGVYAVDPVNKTITLRLSEVPLAWCEGRRPLPDGAATMHWWKAGDGIHYRLDAPAGYAVTVENNTKEELVREP